MTEQSLQDQYAKNSTCFGCGPKNEKGLQIKSFIKNDKCLCEWSSKPHHEAFPGILNGGIIASLLDCHANWTATYFLMKKDKKQAPDCTVTADFAITYLAPTPTQYPVTLTAWVYKLKNTSATIKAELFSQTICCAKATGTFVAVKKGHPAYNRW